MSSPAGTAPGAEDSSPPSQRGPSPGSASGSTGRKTPQRRGSNKNRKPRQNSTSSNTSPASSEVKPSPANRSTHNRNPSRRGSHNGNNGPKNGPTVDNVSQSNPSDTVRQHSPIQQRRPAAPPAANINLTQQGAQPNHNMNPSASTLNPNAGGFQPGGLSALAEVQNEVLLTPTGDTFEMNSMASVLDQANAMGSNQPGVGGHNQQPPSIAQQIAQLQQLQLMQQSLGPNAPPQQLEQILNMQSNLMAQIRLAQAAQGTLPPRFAANQGAPQMSASGPHQQAPMTSTAMPNPALFASGGAGGQNPMQAHFQPQNQDMSALVNEQLAIQEQLEMLKAQQQDLLTRFADIQQTSPTEDMSSASAGMGGIPRAGHRRHQSQQPAGMSTMGQFATGMPAPTGFGSMGQQQQLPKGHGRRHSVNVVSKQNTQQPSTSPTLMRSGNNNGGNNFQFPYSNPMQGQVSAPMEVPGAELDFGASPSSGQTGNATGPASVAHSSQGQQSGWTPGHRNRESRSSISSLSGWGTTSGHYVQNAVPSATPTDLAQALSQLQQLSTFRASAGHAKVPSFGMSNNQNIYGGHQQGNNQQRKSLFGPYLPAQSIPPLVAANQVVVGTLRVNKRNRSDAYVTSDHLDSDIYISGSKDRNRALEGDVVAVQLLDVDEVWGAKKEKEEKKRKKEENAAYDPRTSQNIRKQDKKNDDVEVEGQGLTLFDEEEVTDEQRPQFAGHVVGVVHRAPGQVFAGTLGVLRPSSAATKEKQDAERREREGVDLRGKSEQAPVRIVWLRPVDKRVPLLAIPVNEAPEDFVDNPDKYANRLFVASIKRWPITSLHPFGSLGEELGPIGDIETETHALMKDCNFATEEFHETVTKCVPPLPYSISAREIEARHDLRETRVFTIDPNTAKDLDDALHITRKDNGTFEVGVHIADVSHYVKPNTAIDREARKRATTVYLVQRAYPMLPNGLSEDVCSLSPGEDKLAFSVIFTMSPEARVTNTWYGKTVIRSCAKLAYSEAQEALDKNTLPESVAIQNNESADSIKGDLRDLMNLARQLRQRRFDDNGALRIDNIKLAFTLDAQGLPQDCQVQEPMESKHLIEEFMLLSNMSVAQRIAAGLPEQALLRRHEMPIERRLQGFSKRAKNLGVDIDISSAGALMKSLDAVTDVQARLTLKVLSTKAMQRAKYFCSGMLDISQYHHYALNVALYTHFTSPIRRYADVMVHRQLEAILLGAADTKFPMTSEAVSEVAQICNSKKDAAAQAQEQSQHLFLCTMISNLTLQYGPVIRTAQVIGVLEEAYDVIVPDFGIEKRVHIEQMPVENHVHDEQSNSLAVYWKKGVDVVKWLADHSGDAHLQHIKQTAERHANMMEASTTHASDEQQLFEDDDVTHNSVPDSDQHRKSADKTSPTFEGTEITAQGHHIQTIEELQKVPVIITADVSKSPPVLKVISLNPFP